MLFLGGFEVFLVHPLPEKVLMKEFIQPWIMDARFSLAIENAEYYVQPNQHNMKFGGFRDN